MMQSIGRGGVPAAACLALAMLAQSASASSPEDVQAFVKEALDHIHSIGKEQAFADFSRPNGGFVRDDLYIFCQAADGTVVAHGGNPAIVGRNFGNVLDPDGKAPNRELNRVGLTYGQGWVHFKWPNPVTKKVQPKSAWVVKVDDETVCGSGYYHD
jgi:signal transduction histidine kinase